MHQPRGRAHKHLYLLLEILDRVVRARELLSGLAVALRATTDWAYLADERDIPAAGDTRLLEL